MDEIKILYENKEYELSKQQLNKLIALAAKQLRKNSHSNLKVFSILRTEKPVRVFIKGYESEMYKEMNSELVYAIESGLLENYEKKRNLGKERCIYIPKVMKLPRIKIGSMIGKVF